MTNQAIAEKILWSTIESDVGLWEVLWELNTLLPKNNLEANLKIGQNILRVFICEKIVTIKYAKWGDFESERKQMIISKEKALLLIGDANNWRAPSINETCILIACTQIGTEFYKSGSIAELTFD